MTDNEIHDAISILRREVKKYPIPIVTQYAQGERNPFHILISTLLSLRTKDQTTAEASHRLLSQADSPEKLILLSEDQIEKLIYPVGFYRVKSKSILSVCHSLINSYEGQVPDDLNELLRLKGVGRKTANLVITLGFNKAGICVDTHVHRIANRWGYIKTKNPDETEMALRDKLPMDYWIEFNDLLVTYGQNLCVPISPWCTKCGIALYCDGVDVTKSR